MSPRAAWRLESLGFTEAYDYVPGEADWFAYALPMEGAQAALPHVGQLARRDVPRCGLLEKIGAVREGVRTAGWHVCVVVNEESVVLGLLRERELAAAPEKMAEQVMRSGPATYRPDALIADVVKQLETRDVQGFWSPSRMDGWLAGCGGTMLPRGRPRRRFPSEGRGWMQA